MAQAQSHQTTEDDLTAVLGRFRAWNQNSEETPDERPERTEPAAGLQEMTYEEALGARVRRAPAKPASPHNEGPRARMEAEYGARSARTPAAASIPSKAAANSAPKKPALAARGATANKQQATRFAAAGNRSQTAAKSKPAGRTALKPATKVSHKASPLRPTPYFYGTQQGHRAGEGTTPKRPQPSFREVLEDDLEFRHSDSGNHGHPPLQARHAPGASAGMRRASVSSGESGGDASADGKSIAMKLRVSPQEHAKIKAGAAEAGVTLAAYMRQCTLDVKVLRGLLTQTIADLQALPRAAARSETVGQRRATVSAEEPEPETMFARLITAFFGGKTPSRKKAVRT